MVKTLLHKLKNCNGKFWKGELVNQLQLLTLAVAAAMQGKRVGILDADIYGPNIPRMMGLNGKEVKLLEIKQTIKCLWSRCNVYGYVNGRRASLIWRGAMIMKAIQQLLRDILWEELDILFIDMPPGTGDAQLTLAQSVPVSAGINVTTPQHVALDDSRRSLDMFKNFIFQLLELLKNMVDLFVLHVKLNLIFFGMGTCEELAKQYNTKY